MVSGSATPWSLVKEDGVWFSNTVELMETDKHADGALADALAEDRSNLPLPVRRTIKLTFTREKNNQTYLYS